MITALGIMILWTWGLTPLWVNVAGTVLLGARFLGNLVIDLLGDR